MPRVGDIGLNELNERSLLGRIQSESNKSKNT